MSESTFKDSLITLLEPVRNAPANVDVRIKLPESPVDLGDMQQILNDEMAKIFPVAKPGLLPEISLMQTDEGLVANMNFADLTHMLGRYRQMVDPTNVGNYQPITSTPALNSVLASMALENGMVLMPYQSMDEVGARRIVHDVNGFFEKSRLNERDIQFVSGEDGPLHLVPPDTMLYLDKLARDNDLGKWDDRHIQRIRDLGRGLGMLRSSMFKDKVDVVFKDEPFIEGVEEIAELLPDTVDRSFTDRLAEERAKGGSGPAIGGDGKPGEVVDMRGKPWTGRDKPTDGDGSGE